ncbi:NifU family protein [Rhodomicrobium sp. Az07]|uniref:NifU family protein n=1 Tax=Rhodomicrobium sp. Az07 TaxID=2839034 RepID=UPI001BE61EC7|nr:NifU family protein [Rhodomicrobium sp. Az07]MBT3071519.1 NifU family protein [Rhodomicrobium sp. Az07]
MFEVMERAESVERDAPAETAEETKLRLIRETIEDLRPHLKRDGGDCELLGVDGNVVKVRMTGACVGCQLASVTVHGIQAKMIAKLGYPVRLIPTMGGH